MMMLIAIAAGCFLVGFYAGWRLQTVIIGRFVASMPPIDRSRWMMLMEARLSVLRRKTR